MVTWSRKRYHTAIGRLHKIHGTKSKATLPGGAKGGQSINRSITMIFTFFRNKVYSDKNFSRINPVNEVKKIPYRGYL